MTKPIRVLQVFALMNRGGAETMIMNLYRNIDRSKVQFDFVVHTEEECAYDEEIKNLGGKIYRIPRYTGRNHLAYKKAWVNFFRTNPEYMVIHGHVRSTASIYLKIAKKYKLITIAHSHSTSSGSGFSAIAKNILQYPIRYVADHLFACSRIAGEWLFGRKACNNYNFHILNNAIDTQKFVFNNEVRDKKRKEFQIERKFVIGHIGSFHSPKNHIFLIDVFREVYNKNSNAHLLLIGDGEQKELINNKVNEMGLSEEVTFTGVRSDIPEMLQVIDVFLFPSKYEGLGIAVVEAQAAGLPCVISDTIPKEAIVTELVTVRSLSESPITWAESVLKHSINDKRIDTIKELVLKGFEVKNSSKWLQEFYLGLMRI